MAIARVVWGVAINLVELGVIFATLQAGEHRFERLVLAALALIYLSVQQAAAAFGRAIAETGLRSSRQFYILSTRLNDPSAQDYAAALEESEKQFKDSELRWWLDVGASAIGWLMALRFLFRA